ncbi:DUF2946 family protein [Methylocystis iwaonis]|uniref:DUF2946 family protein n=1 Tax=Methylocystis iwaonis TaxID=2885079 RepID=UPI002E7ABD97|nr:DUF2946 family protein [Methylocystis iwaonis]
MATPAARFCGVLTHVDTGLAALLADSGCVCFNPPAHFGEIERQAFFMPRVWLTKVLFALALAVQVLAPLASSLAAARESEADPAIGVCLKAPKGGQSGSQAPGHSHGGRDCPICQAFCDGVAPIASRPTSLGMAPVQWVEFRWFPADRALASSTLDEANRARGPPSFS